MLIGEIFAGFLGGIAGGMGMGGGTLTIPILTLILAYKQLEAQGVNLIAFLPMSVFALIVHVKNKLVDFKATWGLAVIGCVFSLVGALLANHLGSVVLKKLFALFLIGLGIWQIVDKVKNQKKDKNK